MRIDSWSWETAVVLQPAWFRNVFIKQRLSSGFCLCLNNRRWEPMSDEALVQRGQCPLPDTVVKKLNTRPGFKNGNLEGQTVGTTIYSKSSKNKHFFFFLSGGKCWLIIFHVWSLRKIGIRSVPCLKLLLPVQGTNGKKTKLIKNSKAHIYLLNKFIHNNNNSKTTFYSSMSNGS